MSARGADRVGSGSCGRDVCLEPGATLAFDLGSSSVRAVVLDETFEPVRDGIARETISVRHDHRGAAEVDADEYVDAAAACVDRLRRDGFLSSVTAVAVSSQWHSILAVGRDHWPRSPVLTWADTRPTSANSRLPADPALFHERTGTWVHGLYWTTRIPWLRAEQSAADVRFLGLPEYLGSRLLGDDRSSVSMASGTGLLDLQRGSWDREALAIAGVAASALPEVATNDWRGFLSSSMSRRWPELAAVPWLPATGDGAASNIGAGCSDPGRIAVTVGTSAAARVVHQGVIPALPHGLWRYSVDGARYVTGMASSAGGNTHAWARTVLRDVDDVSLAGTAPGTTDVIALPFLTGSRPPEEIGAGNGVLAGLGPGTTAADISAAMLESVCFEVARGVTALEGAFGPSAAEVVLNGGAIEASPWLQRAIAAALGRTVRVCAVREMAARGAALVARGADIVPPLRVVVPTDREVERMARSRIRYERFRNTFESRTRCGVR